MSLSLLQLLSWTWIKIRIMSIRIVFSYYAFLGPLELLYALGYYTVEGAMSRDIALEALWIAF